MRHPVLGYLRKCQPVQQVSTPCAASAASAVLQLRSLETHLPMPGITVGDIGPKFGFGGVDNGYMSMDHVRIRK